MIDFWVGLMVHTSFLLCIGMVVIVMRKCPKSQIRTAFICTISAMAAWSLSELIMIDILAVTHNVNMFFINSSYIGLCLVPIALLYLGKVILHPDWKPKPIHFLFLVVPVASIIVVYTNDMHQLFLLILRCLLPKPSPARILFFTRYTLTAASQSASFS